GPACRRTAQGGRRRLGARDRREGGRRDLRPRRVTPPLRNAHDPFSPPPTRAGRMCRGGGSKGETGNMTLNRNVVAALVGGTALLVGGGTALAAQSNGVQGNRAGSDGNRAA